MIDKAFPQVNLVPSAGGLSAPNRTSIGSNTKAAPDFSSLLGDMLSEVSKAQNTATNLNQRIQLGDPKVSIEQTALAMNTAGVQFQMVLQVRNKLVQSYTDIMNMPV